MAAEHSEVTLTVRCACGWEVRGPEDEVVDATIDHGRRIHNMLATRNDVLAMAVTSPIASIPPDVPGKP